MYLPINKKITPDYYHQIIKQRTANPIFITMDWRCLRFIKKHGGICLYCKKSFDPAQYDFGIFYQREAWVLYTTKSDQAFSLLLGQNIQLTGATKILIFKIAPELLAEVNYVIR